MRGGSAAETWVTVRSEGGLLLPDTLAKIAETDPSLEGLRPEDYGLTPQQRLTERISQAWGNVQAHWRSFEITADELPESDRGTTDTREWMRKFFRELGYDSLTFRPAEEIDGTRYPISHRAGEGDDAPPVHIVSFRQDLNRPVPSIEDAARRSPHGLLQAYLNAAPQHLWGIVTNGRTLRLLRDSHHFGRQTYLEFDLQAMLAGELFADFRLLYLVLHRSRLPQPGRPAADCWLEKWRTQAEVEGTRARGALRDGVQAAIEALGTGLVKNPHNAVLRENLGTEKLPVEQYYRQLLALVYRLLFLLVAEERGLLFTTASADSVARQRYEQHYSVSRLRRRAERGLTSHDARQTDLWRALLVTFDAMRDEAKAHALGLEPLGGGLFDSSSCRAITDEPQLEPMSHDPYDARPMLTNEYLLSAMRGLSLNVRTTPYTRVNYRDMDVEELGSVYESLLDHQPSYTDQGEFVFRESNERKSTGSYYTPSSLVRELVSSALEPVLAAAVARGRTAEQKQQNLLALKVCDPACGSGHFLLAAARRMGHELARLRVGEGAEPDPATVRGATREVIRHCIYGVDKNPLAIDLCKVALWIEGHEPGAPIGFLDGHIKRGDSLIGIFDLHVLEEGIPDNAYTAVTNDDKPIATALKKRNKAERPKEIEDENGRKVPMRNKGIGEEDELEPVLDALRARLAEIEKMPEKTVADVEAIARAYDELHRRDDWHDVSLACDLWTWAFFAPLQKRSGPGVFPAELVPTTATVRQVLVEGPRALHGRMVGAARADAERIGFFHWPLQFPDVFARAGKGFDVVLGNPPWERVKLQEKEFFAQRSAEIATAPNKAARDRLLKWEAEQSTPLWNAFVAGKRTAENASLFLRTSGRFPLTGGGDVNLYAVFAEHFRNLLSTRGRAGIIVPTGIATDDSNKRFFGDLVEKQAIALLFDFENRKKLFPAVDSRLKFSLLGLIGTGQRAAALRVAFFLLDPAELHDPDRVFTMTAEQIERVNPNTKTMPIFRTRRDAAITIAIYERVPVLVNEQTGANPWGVTFKRMFDMSNDSHLFRTRAELEALLAKQDGGSGGLGPDGHFRIGGVEWLPLYEAKLIHQFDHRFATYTADGTTRDVTPEEHDDPNFVVTPRYWVEKREVDRAAGTDREWFLGWRDFTNATNARSFISSLFPYTAAGDTVLIMGTEETPCVPALLGSLNSLAFDYVTRQKFGGTHLKFYTVKQLPVLPPETYTPALLELIVPRVLELTYTAYDLTPFARDLGYDGPPFAWNEERRAQLRAELDGIYAHLYGLSRDDFAYILDTFPIVRGHDEKAYREYRTKRLCLEAYERFAYDPAVCAKRPEWLATE